VILLVHDADGVRERALSLFAGRARRALQMPVDVCVLITSNAEVQELNRRHRRKDKPTDVLSFPSDRPELPGNIAISAEIAAANAVERGHSVETELKILILHGLLHLAGYDHENDRGEMEARELALRQEFKLPVGLIERTQSGSLKAGPSGIARARKASR
jgi:probable rRNA maturation factor